MKKTYFIIFLVIALPIAIWRVFFASNSDETGIIYRTAPIERGDATLSFTATGILQPLTSVDVKSKAGGEVVRMAVEEGTEVQRGDLIAVIDPRDTKALFDQAAADLDASVARKTQNELSYEMQIAQSEAAVTTARSALEAARLRLRNLEERVRIQPTITRANIEQAEANYDSATKALDQLEKVTAPQMRAEAQGDFDRTKADLDASKANLERMQSLLAKGYVSLAQVEQAKASYEASLASHKSATQRLRTIDEDLRIQIETAKARVIQAKAALEQAKANEADIGISQRDLEEARQSVKQAEAALKQAEANRKNIDLRKAEIQAAQAAIVRSQVARDNAKVQLESTTVVAPRDGVVVIKYVEEGTIIPPGTSVFSEGTSIVQIADVSRMFVEVNVDEADIGKVKLNQEVRVRLESNPRTIIKGTVTRINPSAAASGGVTQVKVRVEIINPSESKDVKLLPGLNASCEFIISEKKDVLIVPMQAVQRENNKTYVEVMLSPNKIEKREVKLGVTGNAGFEIIEGLKEGEEVVTSKIDRAQILEQQKRMEEAQQQRNPFSGGSGGGGGGGRMGGAMGGGGLGGGLR